MQSLIIDSHNAFSFDTSRPNNSPALPLCWTLRLAQLTMGADAHHELSPIGEGSARKRYDA